MGDISIGDMQRLQTELQEKYRDKWGGLPPESAARHMLWMLAEAGEAAQIIKKHGDAAILDDGEVRGHFTEELCDVLMYLNDVMLCYSITPDEIGRAYAAKHERNMKRW